MAAHRRHGGVEDVRVSYSRKVFIPLTRLCRDDVCHYCTFATTPGKLKVLPRARSECWRSRARGNRPAAARRCLPWSDGPELRWPEAREALAAMGHDRSRRLLQRRCANWCWPEPACFRTPIPGCWRMVNWHACGASRCRWGLMLESASERLCEKGEPHFGSPDERIRARGWKQSGSRANWQTRSRPAS